MDDIRDSVNVLIDLARRRPGEVGYTLSQYELQAFNEAFSTIRDGKSFKQDTGTILQSAIRYHNYDFVKQFLNRCSTEDKMLQEHTSIICDTIISYGTRDPSEIQSSQCGLTDEEPDLEDMITFLLSHGAEFDSRTCGGKGPLFYAVERGFDKTFARLLGAGANPMETFQTPEGSINLLQLAIKSFDRVRSEVDYGSHLHWLMGLYEMWPRIIILLLALDPHPSLPDRDMHDFFVGACRAGSVEDVEILLKTLRPDLQRAVPSVYGEGKITALHAAARALRPAVTRLLLAAGADPHALSCADANDLQTIPEGCSPLQYMVQQDWSRPDEVPEHWFEVSDILLDAGYHEKDATAIMPSLVKEKQLGRITWLLEKGHRPVEVPLCSDIGIIDILVSNGSEIDAAAFVNLAVGCKDGFPTREPSLPLLKYLQSKGWAKLDPKYFGRDACYLMSAGATGTEVLDYMMVEYGFDVNHTFPFFRETRWSCSSTSPESGNRSWSGENPEDSLQDADGYTIVDNMWIPAKDGQETNLLQLACLNEWTDAVRILLAKGAKVACPGLQESAIETVIRRSSIRNISYDEEPLIAPLVRYSDEVGQLVQIVEHTIAHAQEVRHYQPIEDTLRNCDDAVLDVVLDKIQELRQVRLREMETLTSQLQLPQRYSMDELLGITSLDDPPPELKLPIPFSPGLDHVTYVSPPLEGPRSIRLLVLEPASSIGDPIVCTVQTVSLEDCPQYEALSYVWGDANLKVGIEVNGAYLSATKNLVNAMQRIRHAHAPRKLWIDAICIDQNNFREKAHQISLMRDIYMSAERTLMYIGETSDRLGRIFRPELDAVPCEYHRRFETDASGRDEPVKGWGDADPEAEAEFLSLIRRPYFRRTWTIQEYVLGCRPTIVCGPNTCKFTSFLEVIDTFGDVSLFGSLDSSGNAAKNGPKPFHQLDICKHRRHVESSTSRPNTLHISNVLSMSQYTFATDPRDKVFGVLGLCDKQLVPIDYNWSVERVYIEFTKRMIERSRTVNIWNRLSWSRNFPELPSWVPDWSVTDHVGILRPWSGRVERDDQQRNRHVDTQGTLQGLNWDGDFLILRGKRIDAFAEMSHGLRMSEEEVNGRRYSSTLREVIRHWDEMVAELTQQRGIDAVRGYSRLLRCEPFFQGIEREVHSTRELLDNFYVLWDEQFGSGILRKLHPRSFRAAKLWTACWSCATDADTDFEGVKKYAQEMVDTCNNRRLFVTSQGLLGLAPEGAVLTDWIISFPGGPATVVVRPTSQNRVKLIGECILESDEMKRHFGEDNVTPWEEFIFE